jgi:WASH complex subunit strumpellin
MLTLYSSFEDGLRRELVTRLANMLHGSLCFTGGGKSKNTNNESNSSAEFQKHLEAAIAQMQGFRRSFEYIQDYVNIYALRLWQEEFSRLISYTVERECNAFLRYPIQEWQSAYQSASIPIPHLLMSTPSSDTQSDNFMGRLVRELLRLIAHRKTIYVRKASTWYDQRTQSVILSPQLIKRLILAVGPHGLVGMNRICMYMLTDTIRTIFDGLQRLLRDQSKRGFAETLIDLIQNLGTAETIPPAFERLYESVTARLSRHEGVVALMELVLLVGHIQLLRRQIKVTLAMASKSGATRLSLMLVSMEQTLMDMVDVERHDWDGTLLGDLDALWESFGLSDVMQRLAHLPDDALPSMIKHLSLMLFTVLLSQHSTVTAHYGMSIVK